MQAHRVWPVRALPPPYDAASTHRAALHTYISSVARMIAIRLAAPSPVRLSRRPFSAAAALLPPHGRSAAAETATSSEPPKPFSEPWFVPGRGRLAHVKGPFTAWRRSLQSFSLGEAEARATAGAFSSRTFSNEGGFGPDLARAAELRQAEMDLAQFMDTGKASVQFFQLLFSPTTDADAIEEENGELRRRIRRLVTSYDQLQELALRAAESVNVGGPNKGPSYFSQANLYFFLNDLAHAKQAYERAYKSLVEVSGGANDPNVACTLASRASIHYMEGDYARALDLYEQARDIELGCFGEEHILFAQTLHNIGLSSFHLGQFSKAKASLNKATELKRRVYGKAHPDIAASLNGLGAVLKAEGNLELAKLAYEEATKTLEDANQGRDHPDMFESMLESASLAKALGEHEDATETFHRAIQLIRKDQDDPQPLIPLLEMLGESAMEAGKPGDAQEAFKEAIELIRKQKAGAEKVDDLAIIGARCKLHLILLRLEDESVESTLKSLSEVTQVLSSQEVDNSPRNSLTLAQALHTQGAALLKQGEKERSVGCFEESLKIRREVLGEEHEMVGDSLTDIGYVMLLLERFADAESKLREAILVYLKCFGEAAKDHPKIALSYFHLANACFMLNKQLEAERNFKIALTMSREALGREHAQVLSLEKMIRELFPSAQI